jgi:phosphate transport system substrate-binding protein
MPINRPRTRVREQENLMRIAAKLIALFVCLAPACVMAQGGRITVAGSTTVKPIVDAAAPEFKKKNPAVELVIGAGGSGQGIQLVGKGEVAIGMASRSVNEKEKAQFSDLVEHKFGMDGVTLVVNGANAVKQLTKDQVAGIYTGKIVNWKEVGGASAPIVLYTLSSKNGTQEVFVTYFGLEFKESGEGAALVASHRKKGDADFSTVNAKATDDHRQLVAGILTNPNAIGYTSIGVATQIASKGAPLHLVELDGVAPTEANVVNGTYGLSRPLEVVTKGEASGASKDFIEFLSGPEGQALVSKMDYIPAAK